MLPDRVSNPGPLTYETGALPTALRGPARVDELWQQMIFICITFKATKEAIDKIFVCKIKTIMVWTSYIMQEGKQCRPS